MSDPFKSCRLKLARARYHIQDLDNRIKTFKLEAPSVDLDPTIPDQEVHRLKLKIPVDDYALIAGDALTNLNAVLDHGAFTVANALELKRNTYFPSGETITDFENALKGRWGKAPPEIVKLFRSFEPYKGGKYQLWELRDLCNTDKHSSLVPVVSNLGAGNFNSGFVRVGPVNLHDLHISSRVPKPHWDAATNELVVTGISRDAQFRRDYNYDFNLHISVVFARVQNDRPAVDVLNDFVAQGEQVLSMLQAESRRIGVIVPD